MFLTNCLLTFKLCIYTKLNGLKWNCYDIWLCINKIYHHHHVVLLARISLTLSRYFSLSFFVSGRSSGYILYPHIAAVCMFKLVVLLLLGHMWGSIGVHHLWAHPFFSSCELVEFGQMSRVFANGLRDQGSIPGRVIPIIQKMVLYVTLLKTAL